MSFKSIILASVLGVATLAPLCQGQETKVKKFGWSPDPARTRLFCQALPDNLNLLEAASKDKNEDALLYRSLVKAIQKMGSAEQQAWLSDRDGLICLRSYSQGDSFSCVGNATALVIAIRAAYQIEHENTGEKFVAMGSADGMYGLAREAGGLLRSRDGGAYGSAAAKAVIDYGTLWMIHYGEGIEDLSVYSDKKATYFERHSVGDNLKQQAIKHLFIDCQHVTNATDAWTLLGMGCPINVCSSVGFNVRRDENGMCTPRDEWLHSMAVIGRRTFKGEKQFLIQNSWGDKWNPGPYMDDMPWGSFWISGKVMDTMLKQGDSFAYMSINGFTDDESDNSNLFDLGGALWLE